MVKRKSWPVSLLLTLFIGVLVQGLATEALAVGYETKGYVYDGATELTQSLVGVHVRGDTHPASGAVQVSPPDGALLRPAVDFVAPGSLADDGARFVVDSAGSTVLRAQGPQGWINVSEHAARRMTQRGIPIDAVDNALTTQSFDYFHAGVTKTGFYDSANNLFVGTVDDVVTTVFHPSAGQGYINNLLAAGP